MRGRTGFILKWGLVPLLLLAVLAVVSADWDLSISRNDNRFGQFDATSKGDVELEPNRYLVYFKATYPGGDDVPTPLPQSLVVTNSEGSPIDVDFGIAGRYTSTNPSRTRIEWAKIDIDARGTYTFFVNGLPATGRNPSVSLGPDHRFGEGALAILVHPITLATLAFTVVVVVSLVGHWSVRRRQRSTDSFPNPSIIG